jgi:hypothetical protein
VRVVREGKQAAIGDVSPNLLDLYFPTITQNQSSSICQINISTDITTMARVVLSLFLALFVSAQAFMVLPNTRMVSMIFGSLLFFPKAIE